MDWTREKKVSLVKGRRLFKTNFATSSGETSQPKPEPVAEIDDCNIIGSLVGGGVHYPVLDLDIECDLQPSATKGHYHLYIDYGVPEDKYWKLIDALEDCGLLESGYVGASKARGYTAVRPPWKLKGKEWF